MREENKIIEKAVVNSLKIPNEKVALKKSDEAIDELQHLNNIKEKAVRTLRESTKENMVLNQRYFILTVLSLFVAAASLIIALVTLLVS